MTHVVTLAVVAMVLTLVVFHPMYVSGDWIYVGNQSKVKNQTYNRCDEIDDNCRDL